MKLLFLCLIVSLDYSFALLLKDKLSTSDSWRVLERFCFHKEKEKPSMLEGEIYPKYNNTIKPSILLFSTSYNPDYIEGSSQSCLSKFSKASYRYTYDERDTVVQIRINFTHSDYECYYIVLSACDTTTDSIYNQGEINVDYRLQLLNGGNSWHKLLSADEKGLLEICLIFYVIQVILCILIRKTELALLKIDKFHYTVQMLKWSIDILFITYLVFVLYYLYYGDSGTKLTFLRVLFNIGISSVEIILVLLLILLAKGWTITCRKISHLGRMKICIYFCIYTWLTIYCILWREAVQSVYDTITLFDNAPGYLLIVVKGLVIIWFCYAIYITLSKTKTKRHFYYKFFLFSIIWLLFHFILPLCIDHANERKKYTIYYTLIFVFTTLIQLLLSILYYPCRCNKSFPFHQKTADMRNIDEQVEYTVSGKALNSCRLSKLFERQSNILSTMIHEMTSEYRATFRTVQYGKQGGKEKLNRTISDFF